MFFSPSFLETPKGTCLCAVATFCCDWILTSAWRLDFGPAGFGGTTQPDAGTSNETSKKHKMSRLFNQTKTGGSSTPARQHLLPSLEVLRNRGSPPKTFTYKICAIKLPALGKKLMMPNPMIRSRSLNQLSLL